MPTPIAVVQPFLRYLQREADLREAQDGCWTTMPTWPRWRRKKSRQPKPT
jgi:hypothetical protein